MEGESDSDSACGRGWAMLRDAQLYGRIYIHDGEDSWFIALKDLKTK